MKRLFVAAALLGLMAMMPSVASAQTHTCDKPALSGTIDITSNTFQYTACVPGNAVQPDGFQMTVDGQTVDLPAPTPGAAATDGDVPYSLTITVTGNGTHQVSGKYYTLGSGGAKQLSPAGAPFVLNLVKAAPTVAPTFHPR